MNKQSKEDTLKKWAPILNNMGLTGSQSDWMAEYAEMHSKLEHENNPIQDNSNGDIDFPSLFPITTKVVTQTIGTDLVSVLPIGGGNTSDEMQEIRKDVNIENRDRKIESIIENKEFEEMKVEDHPDYIEPKGPSGQLFYLDFNYGGTESNII
jgi:hypothetical protein